MHVESSCLVACILSGLSRLFPRGRGRNARMCICRDIHDIICMYPYELNANAEAMTQERVNNKRSLPKQP